MISRRIFLKNCAYTAFSWPLFLTQFSFQNSVLSILKPDSKLLGRVLFDGSPFYSQPDKKSALLGVHEFNDILSLSQPISMGTQSQTTDVWFKLDQAAYIHSHHVQLVHNILNEPRQEISITGQLAEITVPLSEAWPIDKNNSQSHQMFFYGSTHWVYGIGKDDDHNWYYLVTEGRWGESFYVRAAHMRIFEDEELSSISSVVDPKNKNIVVDTKNQILTAYENDFPVMMCAISSGLLSNNHSTPPGDYTIHYKRPSRHMVHTDKIGINDSELYGVPWVSYFTDSGIAFHGTYWHNDFTQPHSHGCVNLPIHAARWIYLWSDPVVPPREKKYVSKFGTQVTVI